MARAKRKVSVTIDAHLVEEMGLSDVPMSAQVNAAVREEMARRRRQRMMEA